MTGLSLSARHDAQRKDDVALVADGGAGLVGEARAAPDRAPSRLATLSEPEKLKRGGTPESPGIAPIRMPARLQLDLDAGAQRSRRRFCWRRRSDAYAEQCVLDPRRSVGGLCRRRRAAAATPQAATVATIEWPMIFHDARSNRLSAHCATEFIVSTG